MSSDERRGRDECVRRSTEGGPSLSRRAVLRAACGAAVALPLLSAPTRTARADGGAAGPPKRLVVVAHDQGFIMDALVRAGATESAFEFGDVFAPLAPHRADLVVCAGIDDRSCGVDSYNNHTTTKLHQFTGRGMRWGSTASGPVPVSAGGPSVDQVVADRVGTQTRFRSLEFGVSAGGLVGLEYIWRAVGQPGTPENDPAHMFDRVFADAAADPAALARLRRRRASVLDAVLGNMTRLRTQLGRDDRERLDQHAASVRDLERSLQAGGACAPPTIGAARDPDAVTRAQTDLLVAALGCDLTRVASLILGGDAALPVPAGYADWHAVVHAGPTDTRAVPDALHTALVGYFRWYASKVAYLLDRLAATPEGSGTLLDNTLVLYASAFSYGSEHSYNGKTYVLAGRAGGALRTGRYLAFRGGGATHNDLLVSVVRLMGFADATFGDPAFCSGPLPGLL